MHEKCKPHKYTTVWKNLHDKQVQTFLCNLIKDCSIIIIGIDPARTTNYCENYHFVKSRLVPKNIGWKSECLGRTVA